MHPKLLNAQGEERTIRLPCPIPVFFQDYFQSCSLQSNWEGVSLRSSPLLRGQLLHRPRCTRTLSEDIIWNDGKGGRKEKKNPWCFTFSGYSITLAIFISGLKRAEVLAVLKEPCRSERLSRIIKSSS